MESCFVVMPFGKKPLPDGSGRQHDYDKIYRVVIKRAIQQAGMRPLRADETIGSRLIHTDMFRDLRDRPVVLVDLSGNNPNVFYELGVRHVMSSRGTVLICARGTELPFDVKLSRTVFYEYDGENIDWEEVERVVPQIQAAVEEAKKGTPDSPVHALLESVMAEEPDDEGELEGLRVEARRPAAHEKYQKLIAAHWKEVGRSIDELLKEHGTSSFGVRAIGYLALELQIPPEMTFRVARQLYDLQQYDLAVELFETMNRENLTPQELMYFGSAISEAMQGALGSVDRGLQLMQEAASLLRSKLTSSKEDAKLRSELARALNDRAGLREWRWQLSGDESDLREAITLREEAGQIDALLAVEDPEHPLGYVAYNLLKLLLLHRILDGGVERPDTEGYRKRIMALRITRKQRPTDASYLRWYQAITAADLGDEDGSQKLALTALREDMHIMQSGKGPDIGHRQYSRIRRFLEQYAHYWAYPSLAGKVSQLLYVRDE